MKVLSRAGAIFGIAALVAGMGASPAMAAPPDFTVSMQQEGGPGEQGTLSFSSPGCPTILGDTPQPSFKLTKDGHEVQPTSAGKYALGAGSAGTYEVTGTCTYPWSQPKKASATVTVEASASTPPAPSEFTVSLTHEGGPGEQGTLKLSSPGCPTVAGETPEPALILKKDGREVTPTAPGEYALTDGSAGTYTLEGTCAYTWLAPKKATQTVTVEASAPTPDPVDPADDPANQLTISRAEFAETSTGRTLSWQIEGCTTAGSHITVDIKRDGKTVNINNHTKSGSQNASQWPTGVYTVAASCHDPSGRAVTSATKDATLTRANLAVGYDGEQLYSHIPRPGDRVAISSQPTHNRISFVEGGTASSFAPGEKVALTAIVGGTEYALQTLTADEHGDIAATAWIPFDADATEFTIKAIGAHGYVLGYTSRVVQGIQPGIRVSNVDGQPLSLRVQSTVPDGVYAAEFAPNQTVELKLADPSGAFVDGFAQSLTADQRGVVDGVIALPSGLADGRYTVLAPTALMARGYYPAYVFVKNGQVYAQWAEPHVEQAILTFDPAGGVWADGTSDVKRIVANVGETVSIIAAPARDGFSFSHWQGSVYHPGADYVVPAGGHSFTAAWTPVSAQARTKPQLPVKKPSKLPKTGDVVSGSRFFGASEAREVHGVAVVAIVGLAATAIGASVTSERTARRL